MEAIQKELTDLILEKTGKNILNGEYGFIAGTMHPYMEKADKGYMSANSADGFVVWKRRINPDNLGSKYPKILIHPKDYEDSVNQIVEFLNK